MISEKSLLLDCADKHVCTRVGLPLDLESECAEKHNLRDHVWVRPAKAEAVATFPENTKNLFDVVVTNDYEYTCQTCIQIKAVTMMAMAHAHLGQ